MFLLISAPLAMYSRIWYRGDQGHLPRGLTVPGFTKPEKWQDRWKAHRTKQTRSEIWYTSVNHLSSDSKDLYNYNKMWYVFNKGGEALGLRMLFQFCRKVPNLKFSPTNVSLRDIKCNSLSLFLSDWSLKEAYVKCNLHKWIPLLPNKASFD